MAFARVLVAGSGPCLPPPPTPSRHFPQPPRGPQVAQLPPLDACLIILPPLQTPCSGRSQHVAGAAWPYQGRVWGPWQLQRSSTLVFPHSTLCQQPPMGPVCLPSPGLSAPTQTKAGGFLPQQRLLAAQLPLAGRRAPWPPAPTLHRRRPCPAPSLGPSLPAAPSPWAHLAVLQTGAELGHMMRSWT